MFSKIKKTLFLFLFVGCSNNHNFTELDTVINLDYNASCLDEVPTFVDLYANEKVSDLTINRNFNCLTEALDYIRVKVKSKSRSYDLSQVKNFANKFVFSEKKEADFFKSSLRVKSSFFGGSSKSITFEEIELLKIKLKSLQKLALHLKPVASEVFFKNSFTNEKEKLGALEKIEGFIENLFMSSSSSINMEDFNNLIASFSGSKASKSWIAVLSLLQGKTSKDTQVKHHEKSTFIRTFKRYYDQALELKTAFSLDWEVDRSDFHVLSRALDRLFVNISTSLDTHPQKFWKEEDLEHFFNILNDQSFFSKPLSEDVLRHLIKVIFHKYFPSDKAGLEAKNLRKLVSAWSEIKNFLIESEKIEGHVGKTFPFVEEGSSLFQLFTQEKTPVILNKDRVLFLPEELPEHEFTFQSLFHASWQFLAAKILVGAYSQRDDRFELNGGLKLYEMKEAYLDIFVFLKEIEFLDEGSRESWFRIFNEGNLFVSSARPDDVVGVQEVAEYFAFMLSAHFAGQQIGADIIKECPNYVEICSFDLIQKKSVRIFPSLPGLGKFFAQRPSERSYIRWQKSFEYIAKLANDDSNYKDSHWFRGTVGTQYVEVLFRKYDLDRSGTFNLKETQFAFNDFKVALKLLPQIQGTAAEENENILKTFFNFFVHKGRLPKLRNGRPTKTFSRYYVRCGVLTSSPKCQFESDRSSLMAILAYLTSVKLKD